VGQTNVTFSAKDGSLLAFDPPSSLYAGNTVTNWLAALHKAKVFGFTYKIAISLFGLVVTTLSLTGIFIWWKKAVARKAQVRRLAIPRTHESRSQVAL
jgi:uncharacterized iron-regulated membrane protein